MAVYRALHPIFIADRLYEVGEEFESDLPPGRNWEPVDEAAQAAKATMRYAPEPPLPGAHKTPLVEIPANWRDWSGFDQLVLARRLGMTKGKKEDAIKKIEAELAARSMSAAA